MNAPAQQKLPSDAILVVGLSLPVLTLASWLLHDKFAIRRLHVVSTTQALTALRKLAESAGLPPCEAVYWHGEEVDGTDGMLSQGHFHRILSRIFSGASRDLSLQLVLGGGVNWMVSIASQLAAHALSETRGDGLWLLKTPPQFENHPHYLKPDNHAAVLDPRLGLNSGPSQQSFLQKVILLDPSAFSGPAWRFDADLLAFGDGSMKFMEQSVRLPPLQLAFYRWLLRRTKMACSRPQLANCEGCYACALPAKHLPSLAEDFLVFYQNVSAKPGYIKGVGDIEFSQRVSEYISKINANIRKQTNLALYRQLRITHNEGGYLPAVDKNRLRPENKNREGE